MGMKQISKSYMGSHKNVDTRDTVSETTCDQNTDTIEEEFRKTYCGHVMVDDFYKSRQTGNNLVISSHYRDRISLHSRGHRENIEKEIIIKKMR